MTRAYAGVISAPIFPSYLKSILKTRTVFSFYLLYHFLINLFLFTVSITLNLSMNSAISPPS